MTPDPPRALLRKVLTEAYRGPAWHGASLVQALKSVSLDDARWRHSSGRNTIWELVLHLAYARHCVLGRLGAGPRRKFPRPLRKSWWPVMPDPATESAWKADLALLAECQARLLEGVERAPAARLMARRPGQPATIGFEVLGVALHDTYHTGQIRLLQKLRAGGR